MPTGHAKARATKIANSLRRRQDYIDMRVSTTYPSWMCYAMTIPHKRIPLQEALNATEEDKVRWRKRACQYLRDNSDFADELNAAMEAARKAIITDYRALGEAIFDAITRAQKAGNLKIEVNLLGLLVKVKQEELAPANAGKMFAEMVGAIRGTDNDR